jgi:hypothetical protein
MSDQRKADDKHAEIPMTDLGWTEAGEREVHEGGEGDRHAAGTPEGGAASGGLAGTNIGDGDPDEADLEAEMGSGVAQPEAEGRPPYAGRSGGAVGGTPAEGRASGGHVRGPATRRAGRSSKATPKKKGRRRK